MSQGCNYSWLVGETIWNHPKLTLSQVGEFLQLRQEYVSHPICFDLLTPLTAGARNAGAWRLRDRCWRLRFMAREGVGPGGRLCQVLLSRRRSGVES